MPDTIEAKVTHRFAADPERVYDAWLDPGKVRLWMTAALVQGGLPGEMMQCSIEPVKGGKFLFSDRRDGQEARHWGHYLELERPRKIVFTWITDPAEEANPSTVSLIIEPEPDGGGAIATLYHEMDIEWADYVAQTERGWTRMLHASDGLLMAEG